MVRTSPITSYSTSGLAAHLKDRIRDHAEDNTHRKIWMVRPCKFAGLMI